MFQNLHSKFSKFSEKNPGNFMLMTWLNRNLKIYLLILVPDKFKKFCIQNSQRASKKNWNLCQITSPWSYFYVTEVFIIKTVPVNPASQPCNASCSNYQSGEVATLLEEETIWALPKYLTECSSAFIKIVKATYDILRTDG